MCLFGAFSSIGIGAWQKACSVRETGQKSNDYAVRAFFTNNFPQPAVVVLV
jgi:hypothetical protein